MATSNTAHKIRISERVRYYLEGSQLWADLKAGKPPHESLAAVRMAQKIREQLPRRSDGSTGVELTVGELLALEDYAQTLRAISTASSDRDILADYNAANGMLRRIHKVLP